HPLFLSFASELTSEIPYVLWSMLALYAYVRLLEHGGAGWLGLAAAGIALSVLTRSIGAALVVAIVLDALGRARARLALGPGGVGAAAMVPWIAWSSHARLAYAGYPQEIAVNYRGYLVNLVSTDWLKRLHRVLPINMAAFVQSWSSWIVPWAPRVLAVFVVII